MSSEFWRIKWSRTIDLCFLSTEMTNDATVVMTSPKKGSVRRLHLCNMLK